MAFLSLRAGLSCHSAKLLPPWRFTAVGQQNQHAVMWSALVLVVSLRKSNSAVVYFPRFRSLLLKCSCLGPWDSCAAHSGTGFLPLTSDVISRSDGRKPCCRVFVASKGDRMLRVSYVLIPNHGRSYLPASSIVRSTNKHVS